MAKHLFPFGITLFIEINDSSQERAFLFFTYKNTHMVMIKLSIK